MSNPPVFNYIGGKSNLLPFLQTCIEDYTKKPLNEIKSAIDMFSGSGAVSHMFMTHNIPKVLTNDVQYYSYVMSSSFLKHDIDSHKINKILRNIESVTLSTEPAGFIEKNYSGSYFTNDNAKKIDTMRKHISHLFDENTINEKEHLYLLKCLLYNVVKVSNVTCVYGSYLKKFKPKALLPIQLRLEKAISDSFIINSSSIQKVYNEDVIQFIKNIDTSEIEICFLDPPYCGRRYDTNYHILETIAKNDQPKLRGKTGLRDEPRKTRFVHKATCAKEYEELFALIKSKFVFMCYSSEGVLAESEIMLILQKYFVNVKCYKRSYKRVKTHNNNTKDTNNVTEYLFAAVNSDTLTINAAAEHTEVSCLNINNIFNSTYELTDLVKHHLNKVLCNLSFMNEN